MWPFNLFKKHRHYRTNIECPICFKVVPKKGGQITCGNKNCRLLYERLLREIKKETPSAPSGSLPTGDGTPPSNGGDSEPTVSPPVKPLDGQLPLVD
jgi:hypothetical protein